MVALPPKPLVVEEEEADDEKWNTTPDLMPGEAAIEHFLSDIAKNSPTSLPEEMHAHAFGDTRLLKNMRQGARDISETKKLLLSLN